jgi:capsule polysaccharide export protein KpsE/RkpR
MGIRFKFNLIILLIFAGGFAASAYLVKQVLIENAKQEVALNAGIMMAAAKSARSYTVDEVRPLLHELNSEEFLPQTVPAYSATESMKRMRKTFPDYTYK